MDPPVGGVTFLHQNVPDRTESWPDDPNLGLAGRRPGWALFLQKLQAGYGKFGIKTVWLDAAEPERPSDDTVGQFFFSKGFI